VRRAFVSSLFASLFASFVLSSTAFAQPVVFPGDCSGPECPFWMTDIYEIMDASADNRPCALEPDPALEAKFRSGKKLTPDEFVRFVAPLAQRSEQETGVPASVTIAQAALETGWGKSSRLVANNLFGIKGRGTAGSVKLWTREYVRGRWVRTRASFAAYQNFGDSVSAHGRLISENTIYRKAMAVKDKGPEPFARALQRAGYATDPQYANKLLSIIRKRDLEQYDGTKDCSA
jgi:flagellum-specific peptidoglycan hydrolase FlgJ